MAQSWGLRARVWDPVAGAVPPAELRGIPRPSVIVDLDAHAPETVLVLAHYDVVPVPAEQRARWATPPNVLTERADGRLYGRGSNDDLGSGVVASLLALRRLAAGPPPPRNVRLLICCDEETGGEGGIEAMKHHDSALPPGDPARWIAGDVALIPDGSPHVSAGSSGAVFCDATTRTPAGLPAIVAWGEALAAIADRARAWKSRYRSPDWPDHGAPEPVITGRVTLTKIDLVPRPDAGGLGVVGLHAETDAANQIAESVAIAVRGPFEDVDALVARAARHVPPPFRVVPTGATGLSIPAGAQAISVVGKSAHGGYPHSGRNPVLPTLALLAAGVAEGWLDGQRTYDVTLAIDLRLPPEMPLDDGRPKFLAWAEAATRSAGIDGEVVSPLGRCRGGYALAPEHPAVVRLAEILGAEGGRGDVVGEYGGTDASSLAETRTRAGTPMPALVFGSMDRAANIHQAEESVDPALLGTVARTIERFVRAP